MRKLLTASLAMLALWAKAQMPVGEADMQRIYDEVKTPFKYGMVVSPADNYHKIDCPTVFRQGEKWLMTYVCYNGKDGLDGRGYETWLAESDDLLHWTTLGRILAYPDDRQNLWDQNQRGGFPALIDQAWGGQYTMLPYKGRHYLTYIGGPGTGYEGVNAPLSIGLATTDKDIATAHQWQTFDKPLLSYDDNDAQWWEKLTQYKSTIYWLKDKKQRIKGKEKYPFVMFYNAGGLDDTHPKGERIGIALSKNMKKWQRYEGNPIFAHDSEGTIMGDAQIVRIDSLWVMFYFSAFNPSRSYNAFNTFAVSRDLLNWQDWTGPDLIYPTKPYDEMFAHKSYVVKHDGVVYHFYCAVNNANQRGIAVATSVPMGKSDVAFPAPEPSGRRQLTSLADGWHVSVVSVTNPKDSLIAAIPDKTGINLPHNLDDYYGYRQLRHGNLHGSARYSRSFEATRREGKRYFLEFQGVGTYATVTINGHTYPRELVGRTVFTLDITDHLINGTNSLEVLVDHPSMLTESPWVCGGCSSEWGFSEGSQPFGIYRSLSLQETDEVRIEPFGIHIWNNDACDSVFVDTEIKNYSDATRTVELVNKFTLSSGKQVFRQTQTITLTPGESRTLRQQSPVANVQLWSPQQPYLYNLVTMLKRDGKTTDEVRTPFGIRSLRWPLSKNKPTQGQFVINGQPFFINGTCEYEHILGQSHAFSQEQIVARVKEIKNAGFNAFREGHQPHNLLYQQLFDEQGTLFWSQFSAHIWYDTPAFRENFKRMLVRWIKERRNSPSIILWGLQNESVLPRDFAEECSDIIRSLDPTASTMRLITTCNGGEGTDWNVIQNWSGTYGGNPDNYDSELKQPNQLLNGEYGAWRTLDLHGKARYSEENATKLLRTKALKAVEATDSVCGHFQWLFASHDNPGRTQPDGAYRIIDKIGPINYKGLVTIWDEPTQPYYMYKQLFGPAEGDTLLLTPAHRNSDLLKPADGWRYLTRVNCGGDSYIDHYQQQWHQDNQIISHSWAQDFPCMNPFQASQRHITNDIKGTQDPTLFQYFRFGRHRLSYDFLLSRQKEAPLPSATSESSKEGKVLQEAPLMRVELYFAEPWHGKMARVEGDYEGLRLFSVAINDSTVISDIDLWAEGGYCGAIKKVVYARPKDGRLHISFPETKAGQAVIAAIAIAVEDVKANSELAIRLPEVEAFSWEQYDSEVIEKLPEQMMPRDEEARPATVYEPTKPGTFIIKPGLGQEYALRFRYKNTTGSPITARMKIVDSKNTVLVDRPMTFPATPNKYKMVSTTTGTQINAGTYTLTIDNKTLDFQNLEIQ